MCKGLSNLGCWLRLSKGVVEKIAVVCETWGIQRMTKGMVLLIFYGYHRIYVNGNTANVEGVVDLKASYHELTREM